MRDLANIECDCGRRIKIVLMEASDTLDESIDKVCPICKKSFSTNSRKRKYCSKRCGACSRTGRLPLSKDQLLKSYAELGAWTKVAKAHNIPYPGLLATKDRYQVEVGYTEWARLVRQYKCSHRQKEKGW